MNIEALAVVLGISLAIEGLVQAIFKPLFLRLKWDTWWLFYVALLFGTAAGWFSGLNIFVGWFTEYPVAGRLLTALACGAGPSYLYDLSDKGGADRLPL